MVDVDKPAPACPVDEEVNDESSTETEVEHPDADGDSGDEESAPEDVENEDESVASTEISETATLDILGIPSRSAPSKVDDEAPPALGLNRPWGESDYDDYDVITVHGLRDDHRTAWKSQNGESWLRDRLFQNLSIRQLDYIYATDGLAKIFQRDGIKAEAQTLLQLYSDERRWLFEASSWKFSAFYKAYQANAIQTEVDRPIIWVCHDIGGTIAKQVIMEAAQAAPVEDYEDVETWNCMKEIRRRISTFSTAIIFLGTPHRAESIDVLEDELHNLMTLPGPIVKKGIIAKIKEVAHQVTDINIRALSGNLFSRVVNINVFYLPRLTEELKTKDWPTMQETEQPVHQDQASSPSPSRQEDTSETLERSPMPWIEFPPPPASPFSRHTLTTSHWLEADSRYSQSAIDHLSLVRGDEGVDEEDSWVTKVHGRFVTNYYPLKAVPGLIQRQAALLSLAPSIRYPSVHMEPSFPASHVPEFPDWIVNHQNKFREFQRGLGPRVLYYQGVLDPVRTAMISQYLHTFDERNLSYIENLYGAHTFYFEFHKYDNRCNTIRAMLVTFLNEMCWRCWSSPSSSYLASKTFDTLDYHRCWALSDLFNLFDEVRQNISVKNMAIYLSCLDNCIEEERNWFLATVLKQHSHSDLNYRLIVTTSTPISLLQGSVPESRVLSVSDCPVPLKGFVIDETGIDASGLLIQLEDLLHRRPVLDSLELDLKDLIKDCQRVPHLGYRILDWLGHFGRGMSIRSISSTIEKLRPVTPGNILNVIVGSLGSEKRAWAALVYRWINHAVEPLTIEELGHAIATSSEGDRSLLDIDYEGLSDDLRKVFAGIIVADGRDLKFSHDSFYNVVMLGLEAGKDEEPPSFAHGIISETCLKYLMCFEVQSKYRKLAVDNYGGDMHKRPLFLHRDDLLEYAVQYWAEHYRLAGSHRPVALALEFFRKHETRNRWAEAHYLLSNPFTRIHRTYYSSIPFMAALGLDDVMADQLEYEKDSEWFHKDCWLALTESARRGHKSILYMLLDHAQDDEPGLRDAIFWAISSNNEELLIPLVNRAVSMKNFCWPDFILSRAALVGSNSVISAMSEMGVNLHDTINHPLHAAIVWGQESTVRLLLESGVDPNSRNASGKTPLETAIQKCQPEIVEALLEKGASLGDDQGLSLVNTAIVASDTGSLKVLLKAKANFEGGDPDTWQPWLQLARRPIINAADFSRPDCLRLLVESGADPSTECSQGSVLYLICHRSDQLGNCRLLLQKGADPNQTYKDKEMMLIRMLRSNMTEMVDLFHEYGANFDSLDTWEEGDLKTPLSYAADQCSFGVLKAVLDNGASVDYVPEGAESALFAAAWRGDDAKKLELLLKLGADIHWTRESDGWTPLHIGYDESATVSLLLEHGADIERQCEDGTVLMMAARWGYPETLKTILAHRPNLDAVSNYNPKDEIYGDTALILAVKAGEFVCANSLLDAGAKLSESLQDINFLMMFLDKKLQSEEAAKQFLEACLEHGLKPDQVDENGNTALHGIGGSTPTLLVKFLIDSGSPVDTPNTTGLTPLAVSLQQHNHDAAKLLLSKGAQATVCGPGFGNLLFVACQHTSTDIPVSSTIEILRLLIEAKADVNAPGPEPSRPPLLYTAIHSNADEPVRHELVQYLVEEARVYVDAPSGSQLHPIIAAVQQRDSQLLQYLIRRGANVNVADSQGRRVTHHAVWMNPGNRRRYRILAQAGADWQAPDNYGRTPLHLAAGFGYAPEIAWLFRHFPNLDVDVRDADGWTPLMWACRLDESNDFAVEELKRLGADIWPKSNDGEWSALKLASLSNMDVATQQILQPQESERDRVTSDGVKETWDPLFHFSEPGKVHDNIFCDSCLVDIIGPRYKCTTCEPTFDLCFKCFPHRGTMHDSDHQFQEDIDTEDADSTHDEEASDRGANGSGGSKRESEEESEESEDEPGSTSE